MKFRLISNNGEGAGIVLRLHREKQDADIWLKNKSYIYRGILPQVETWNHKLAPDTILIFDGAGFGKFAEDIKSDGQPVYGSSKLSDALEKNYTFALQVAKSCRLKLPAWGKFDNYEGAIDFVKRSGKTWVYKRNGYVYVAEDNEDCYTMLEYFKGFWDGPFILQEKIEGTEVTVEQQYINGEPVHGSLNSSVRESRFFDGDKGPVVGCMGSVVWFWQKLEPKIYRLTLQKVEPFLRKFKYCGPLSVKAVISKEDKLPYFIGFRSHFRFGEFYALCRGMNSLAGFLSSLAISKRPEIERSFNWLGSVRVSVPPYPYTSKENVPVGGVDNAVLLGVRRNGEGRYYTAGMNGVVCDVVGNAKTIPILNRRIYEKIDTLRIPEKQFRSDVIKCAKSKVGFLKKWKYFSDR